VNKLFILEPGQGAVLSCQGLGELRIAAAETSVFPHAHTMTPGSPDLSALVKPQSPQLQHSQQPALTEEVPPGGLTSHTRLSLTDLTRFCTLAQPLKECASGQGVSHPRYQFTTDRPYSKGFTYLKQTLHTLGAGHYKTHFADEETEAYRGQATC